MLPNPFTPSPSEGSVDDLWNSPEAEPQELASSSAPEVQEPAAEDAPQQDSPEDALVNKILAKLTPQLDILREENRRTRQSMRDTGDNVLKRVNQQLAQQSVVLDKAVKRGLLSPDEARSLRDDLRYDIESQAIQQPPAQPDEVYSLTQYVLDTIWETSGLDETDPEAKEIRFNLTGLPPTQAIEQYRQDVQKAQQKKAQRQRSTAKPKSPPSVLVDLGTGQGKQPRTVTEILNEITVELGKPYQDDDKLARLNIALEEAERRHGLA